jgi:hypothetical protein
VDGAPVHATECQLLGCNKTPKLVPSEDINAFFKSIEAEEKKPGTERYEQLSNRFSFLVDCGPPSNLLSLDALTRAGVSKARMPRTWVTVFPSLGKHRDGDHALDGTAKLCRLADGVHNLAEQFLVGDALIDIAHLVDRC